MKAGTLYLDKKTHNRLVLLSKAFKTDIEERFVGLTEIAVTDYRNFLDLKSNKVIVRNLYELEELKQQYTEKEREAFLTKCRLLGMVVSSEEGKEHIHVKDLKALDCIALSCSSGLFRSLLSYHVPFAQPDKYLLRKEPDGSFSLLIGYEDYLFCTVAVKEIEPLQFAVSYGHLYGRVVKEPKWKSYSYTIDKDMDKRIVNDLAGLYWQYAVTIENEDSYNQRVFYCAKKCNREWIKEQFQKYLLPDLLYYVKSRGKNSVFIQPEGETPFYVNATLTKESVDLLINRLCTIVERKLGKVSARCNLGSFYIEKGLIREDNGRYYVDKRVYDNMSDLLEQEFTSEQNKDTRLQLLREHIYYFLREKIWN